MKKLLEDRERFQVLDSMRGVAALAVMIQHLVFVTPTGSALGNGIPNESVILNLLTFTPLHMFWGGGDAVCFFFVLSGFVLSIPFINNSTNLPSYYIKRFFRIYPPYVIAVLVGAVACRIFFCGPVLDHKSDLNDVWHANIDWNLLIEHLFLITSFDTSRFDLPIWSLVVEMRISILFPFIIFLVQRYDWKVCVFVTLMTGLISSWVQHLIYHNHFFINYDYVRTFHFVSFFFAGSILALNRTQIILFFRNLSLISKINFLVLSLLAYTNGWWLSSALPWYSHWPHFLSFKNFLQDFGICAGISGLIVVGLSSQSINRILTIQPLVFLGKISYSLYLYHFICLLSLLSLFKGKTPILYILAMSGFLSLFLAVLGYRFIELPSMNLGRHLAGKFSYKK